MNATPRRFAAPAALAAMLVVALLSGACYNGTSLRIARERMMANDAEAALRAASEALSLNPRHVEARDILVRAGAAFADDVIARVRATFNTGGRSTALIEAAKTERLLARLEKDHAASFGAARTQLAALREQLSEGEAAAQYAAAEKAFAARDWEKAREGYARALYFAPGYRDCAAKLAECYMNIGEDLFGRNLYRAASESFAQVLTYTPDDARARGRMLESHLQLAQWYRQQKYHRLEFQELLRVRGISASYPNLETMIREARENATVRLAVLPLKARTGVPFQVGSLNIPELVQNKVGSKLSNRKSEFVRMLDRQNVDQLMKEIYFSRSDFAEPGMKLPIEAFEICDAVITGQLTQMNVDGPTLEETWESGSCAVPLWRDEVRHNQDGSRYIVPVVYGNANIPYRYVEAHKKVAVQLAGSILVLDVASSRTEFEKAFSLADRDAAHYAHSFEMGRIPPDARTSEQMVFRMQVPGRVKELLDAPRDVRAPDDMMERLCDTITTEWVVEILRAIDTEPDIPEPFARR